MAVINSRDRIRKHRRHSSLVSVSGSLGLDRTAGQHLLHRTFRARHVSQALCNDISIVIKIKDAKVGDGGERVLLFLRLSHLRRRRKHPITLLHLTAASPTTFGSEIDKQ